MSGTTGVVAFDYAMWAARYPELSAVSPGLAAAYFAEAGLYLANNGSSRVRDLTQRQIILNMITAHIATLAARNEPGDSASPALVGRIASASEGSVSVSTDLQVPGSAAWWAQSSPGLAAWQALAPLRTMRYFPAARSFR